MNKRQQIMSAIEELTEDESVHEVVKDFIDDMENAFNDFANTLSHVDIDRLDSIVDVRNEAGAIGKSLY